MHHPLIRIALKEIVDHYGRLFEVARKVAQTVSGRLRNIITPGYSHRSNNIRIQHIKVEVVHGAVEPFKRIRAPLLFCTGARTPHQKCGSQRKRRQAKLHKCLPVYYGYR
ncbi:hypothetical protein D3C73_898620 [compost metagenome]